jgi:transposase
MAKPTQITPVVGGVETHKDLHAAAVVDQSDRVLGTQSFATTLQGYKPMLTWMRSLGDLQRIGVECTGSYPSIDQTADHLREKYQSQKPVK